MAVNFAFDVQLDGDYLIRALSRARAEIMDKPMLTSIGLSLKKRNENRQLKEVTPDGVPWVPLKPATIKHKKNPRMLVEHGDMLRLYSHADSNSVTVGTADRKAYWHHHGTLWKPRAKDVESGKKNYFEHTTKHLPARPLVGFPTSDKVFIIDLVEDHLKAVLNRR